MSALRLDAHAHVYGHGYWPAKWFDFVAAKWAEGKEDRRAADIRDQIEDGMADPGAENLLRQMDEVGLDKAVIFALDWELGMGEAPATPIETVHADYEEIVRTKEGRLAYFCSFDPRRENAPELLSGCIERGTTKGLKLYPPSGFYPYEEEVAPLLDMCQAARLPVAVHTGGTIGLLRPRFANPIYLQDVQRQFPGLTLWIAHAGAQWWWEEALAVAANGLRSYLELSSWQEVAFHHEERFIRMLDDARRKLGTERLLFGSDHFSGTRVRGTESLRRWVAWWEELPGRAKRYGISFSDSEVDAILGENAQACLGP